MNDQYEPTAANTEFYGHFGVLCVGSLVRELFLEVLGVDKVLAFMEVLACVSTGSLSIILTIVAMVLAISRSVTASDTGFSAVQNPDVSARDSDDVQC